MRRLQQRFARKYNGDHKAQLIVRQREDQLKQYWSTLHDSTSTDSMKQKARLKLQEIVLEKATLYPGFQYLSDKHQMGDSLNWKDIGKQVPGLDTLQGLFNSSPAKLFSKADEIGQTKMLQNTNLNSISNGLGDVEKLKTLPGQYKSQFNQYTNKDSLLQSGRQKLLTEAVDHFSNRSNELQSAQGKVSNLLAKYRDFTNSNNLKDAVKQTSLKGKTFFERIVVGGNFNVISLTPLSLDLSPSLGYSFNSRFVAGIGMNYRQTFSDSIRNSRYISPSNTGFKVFANYDIMKNFYSYAEWDRGNLKVRSNDAAIEKWKDNYFIGVGKRMLIHPKLYMTITALYNLNSETKNPLSSSRFQLRAGVQLSELATRKRKVYYDPNR